MTKRDSYLRRKYGLTLAQYNEMLRLQNGRCKLCGRKPKRILHVDHDHFTGRVRGLLDYYCNRRVIGRHRFPEVLERAAAYLRSTFDGRALVVPERSSHGAKPSTTTRTVRSKPSA